MYALRLTSLGPYRIFGYLSVPPRQGPFPELLAAPHYGSVNHLPHMHRGQRLADQPFAAAYPGLLTLGIEDPRIYIYRGIVADCLCGRPDGWPAVLPPDAGARVHRRLPGRGNQ